MAVAARIARLVLGHEGELRQLLLALDPAAHLDAPHRVRSGVVAKLGEGDLHLRGPAQGIDRGADLPDRIPREVVAPARIDVAVVVGPGGVHPEAVRGQMVVMGIEEKREVIGREVLVTANQTAPDLPRLPIEEPRSHVESIVPDQDADLRPLGDRLPLLRVMLREPIDRLRLRPDRLVQLSVQLDVLAGLERVDLRGVGVAQGVRGVRSLGERGSGDEQGSEEDHAHVRTLTSEDLESDEGAWSHLHEHSTTEARGGVSDNPRLRAAPESGDLVAKMPASGAGSRFRAPARRGMMAAVGKTYDGRSGAMVGTPVGFPAIPTPGGPFLSNGADELLGRRDHDTEPGLGSYAIQDEGPRGRGPCRAG